MATLPIVARPDELRRLGKQLISTADEATTTGAMTVTLDNAPGDASFSVTAPNGKKGKV